MMKLESLSSPPCSNPAGFFLVSGAGRRKALGVKGLSGIQGVSRGTSWISGVLATNLACFFPCDLGPL